MVSEELLDYPYRHASSKQLGGVEVPELMDVELHTCPIDAHRRVSSSDILSPTVKKYQTLPRGRVAADLARVAVPPERLMEVRPWFDNGFQTNCGAK